MVSTSVQVQRAPAVAGAATTDVRHAQRDNACAVFCPCAVDMEVATVRTPNGEEALLVQNHLGGVHALRVVAAHFGGAAPLHVLVDCQTALDEADVEPLAIRRAVQRESQHLGVVAGEADHARTTYVARPEAFVDLHRQGVAAQAAVAGHDLEAANARKLERNATVALGVHRHAVQAGAGTQILPITVATRGIGKAEHVNRRARQVRVGGVGRIGGIRRVGGVAGGFPRADKGDVPPEVAQEMFHRKLPSALATLMRRT